MQRTIHFFASFLLIYLIFSMAVSPAAAISSASNPHMKVIDTGTALPGDEGWSTEFIANGVDAPVRAIAIDGHKVYVGGDFVTAGDAVSSGVTMWDGAAWHSLGFGIEKSIDALAVDGRGNLYVGGYFTSAGGVAANNIIRWNGSAWEALGFGVNGEVSSITVDSNGYVVVGGNFLTAGGITVNHIARWDGSAWEAIDRGVANGSYKAAVYALAIDRYGFLYAGGLFNSAGGGSAHSIARWDGLKWSEIGGGIQGELYNTDVRALDFDGRGNLVVGGSFTQAGEVPANNIAWWDSEAWHTFGEGVITDVLPIPAVEAITADGITIYAAGTFSKAGGQPAGAVARWNGSSWETLQGGVSRQVSSPWIHSLEVDRWGNVFAGGDFDLAGGMSANRIARWDGNTWQKLGQDNAVNNSVLAMAVDNQDRIYVGGQVNAAGGQIVNHVAMWDGAQWSGFNGGVVGGAFGTYVRAVAVDSSDNFYVGGGFTRAGGRTVSNIAKWNGRDWEDLGGGVDDFVFALALDSQDNLYAEGNFENAGGVPAHHIAMWDGQAWHPLGSGIDSQVNALAVDASDRLIAVGSFSYAGDVAAHGIARWDSSGWSALSDQMGIFETIAIDGDVIYLGYCDVYKLENSVIQLVGGAMETGDPMEKPLVNSLALDQKGCLIAGGYFTTAGGALVHNIARWNGASWEALGSGTDTRVNSLVFDRQGSLYAGGTFSIAGGKAASKFSRWEEPPATYMPVVFG